MCRSKGAPVTRRPAHEAFGDEDRPRRRAVHRREPDPAPRHDGEAVQHHPLQGHDLAPLGVELRLVVLAGHEIARGPLDPLGPDPGRDVGVDRRGLHEIRRHDPVHPGRFHRGGARQDERPVPGAAILASLGPNPDVPDVSREHRAMDLRVGRAPRRGAKSDLAGRDEELAIDVHPLAGAPRGEKHLLAAPPPGGRAHAPALSVQELPQVEISHEVGARIGEAAVRRVRRSAPLPFGRRLARVTGAQDSRDHQDLGHAVELPRGEDHPPEPRIHGQAGQPPPDRGDPVLAVERPELAQEPIAVRHETAVRRLDEGELVDPSEPARRHREDDGREVRAADLGRGEPGPTLEVLARVEAHAYPRADPPAPSAPLIGRGARHRLDGKALDLGAVAVAAHAGETGIDHEPDPGHGDRSLRDVGREHHAPALAGTEDALLLGVVEPRIEGEHLELPVRAKGPGRLPDVALAGKEDEDVAGTLPCDGPNRVGHGRDRVLRGAVRFGMADLDRMGPSRHVDDRRACEEVRDAFGIERRGAHDHAQIGATGKQLPDVAEQEVDIEGAFVRLVDDERVVCLEAAVAGDLGHQDPVRHDLHAGIRSDFVAKADLAADGAADPAPELARDAGGHASRGDPARLGMSDPAARSAPRSEADLRELGRLSGAGLAADHDHGVTLQGRRDRVALRGDRKLGGEVGHGEPCASRRAGGARAFDGGLEPSAAPGVGFSEAAQARAETAPVADHRLVDRLLEIVPVHRGGRAFRHRGHRPGEDAAPRPTGGRSARNQSSRAWVPSQYGAPPVRLQPQRNTRRASSSSNRCGTNCEPRWAPSQNGWRSDRPHRHQK